MKTSILSVCAGLMMCASLAFAQNLVVKGKTVYTMAGNAITDGVVVMKDGKIAAVGKASEVKLPDGVKVIEAAVVTPGLVDARGTVGVSGLYNTKHDSDQLERSAAIQPEMRAIDAYNPMDKLVEWLRGFGITTVNTGNAPGALVSGQTIVVKTVGNTVDEAVILSPAMVTATIGPDALESGGKAPGTRGKQVAMLREELIKAKEYAEKRKAAEAKKKAGGGKQDDANDENNEEGKGAGGDSRNLRLEMLSDVLEGKVPLTVTVNRAQDIESALRVQKEFGFKLILDMAAESYLVADQLKKANIPVILHPTMYRAVGETENLSFETAAKLKKAGVLFAIQSGYESYVPKTRVVLFEAAIAAANGLKFEDALASITIDAAKIIGVDNRVGSLEVGKDADLALYDGDPFEYTSHCLGTVIDGRVVSETKK
ncbi:MAG: amidohydrolase family protein [Phycisphaeraceae bacterium]|nr:amidohydrolase family protein [Phycisphaeraceae bacterium]